MWEIVMGADAMTCPCAPLGLATHLNITTLKFAEIQDMPIAQHLVVPSVDSAQHPAVP